MSKLLDLPGEVWDVSFSPRSGFVARHVDPDDDVTVTSSTTVLPTEAGRVVSGAGGIARLRRILCLQRTKVVYLTVS